MEKHLLHIGEMIDQLVSLEIRAKQKQGVVPRLYAAARAKTGGPLALAAAQLLVGALGPGKTVLLTTGAGHHDFLPFGETDGPPGLVALASALSYGLGAVPVLVTEAEYLENVKATALAAGLGIRDYETARRVPFSCAVLSFPADDSAPAAAEEYLARYQPSALVSVEKLGPNHKGVTHSATGMPATPLRARVEHLFDLAAERSIPTVGVGDNGNEIGCGLILEAVHEHKPWGKVCQCPCEGGLATRVATDVLVMGGTSNWGAYGVVACIAAILGRPELIQDPETEKRVLDVNALTGAADGSTGRHVNWVDGTPPEVSVSIQVLMKNIVAACIKDAYKRPF